MRIKSIYVNNFKSLVDFRIDLAKFNCIIGLNGSGKSTFLQFVCFLTQLMKGNMREWLKYRDWDNTEFSYRRGFLNNDNLSFRVEFLSDDGEFCGFWEGTYSFRLLCCVRETINFAGYTLITKNSHEGSNTATDEPFFTLPNSISLVDHHTGKVLNHESVIVGFEGSILSVLFDKVFLEKFLSIKEFLDKSISFDLFSPKQLRQPSVESYGFIGAEGEDLAAFLFDLDQEKLSKIQKILSKAFPHVTQLATIAKGSINGKTIKQLSIRESTVSTMDNKNLEGWTVFNASHINDGLLRLIAIVAQLETDHRFLLFDEIENGINPELVGFLLSELLKTNKQIVVTTHSPMILNYLDDETAIPGVHFFYKTPEGFTQTIPFLQIPSMREKLEVMGPGEVFIDTDLACLARELSAQNPQTRREK